MTLGFVSGSLGSTTTLSRLDFYRKIGCTALELHTNLEEQMDVELSLPLIRAISNFEYVSLHAPGGQFVYDDSPKSEVVLAKMDQWIATLPIKLVVVHPDRIRIPEVLLKRNWPIAIENMDRQKTTGQTIAQMQSFFEKFPKAGMVLDINHTFTLDPSQRLAQEMYAAFAPKIKEVHFSGYINEKDLHEPITTSGCEHFLKSIPDKQLPIIIEVLVSRQSEEVLQKEFETIRDYLEA